MRITGLTIGLMLLVVTLGAQVEKTLYETIPVGEASELRLQLVGSFSIEPWAGNNILAETEVKLYQATPEVLNFFVEEKNRYGLDTLHRDSSLVLRSFDQVRAPIQYRDVECYEEVHLRLFLPDHFKAQSDTLFTREE